LGFQLGHRSLRASRRMKLRKYLGIVTILTMDIKEIVSAESDVLDQLLESFSACLTPTVAKRIVAFRADAKAQARIAELADKCNEGELTASERREYEAYVRAIDFISILQAKARLTLRKPRKAS